MELFVSVSWKFWQHGYITIFGDVISRMEAVWRATSFAAISAWLFPLEIGSFLSSAQGSV